MKAKSQIVAGGGWRGTRLDRIKVKAWIALILAMFFGGVSILSIGSVLFYACIPAAVSLTVSVVLFIREQPIEIESLSGRVGSDPRKLYGRFGGCGMATTKCNEAGSSEGDEPSN